MGLPSSACLKIRNIWSFKLSTSDRIILGFGKLGSALDGLPSFVSFFLEPPFSAKARPKAMRRAGHFHLVLLSEVEDTQREWSALKRLGLIFNYKAWAWTRLARFIRLKDLDFSPPILLSPQSLRFLAVLPIHFDSLCVFLLSFFTSSLSFINPCLKKNVGVFPFACLLESC